MREGRRVRWTCLLGFNSGRMEVMSWLRGEEGFDVGD